MMKRIHEKKKLQHLNKSNIFGFADRPTDRLSFYHVAHLRAHIVALSRVYTSVPRARLVFPKTNENETKPSLIAKLNACI